MTDENRTLRQEAEALRTNWQAELAAAERRARDAAAIAYIRDDENRLSALIGTLGDARQAFDRHLLTLVRNSAIELAATALEKLVSARQEDRDWLARIVEHRLDMLDESAVISVQVAEDDFADPVGAILPEGTHIERSAALSPGTARITLRLGTIEIDPAAGLQRLTDLLRLSENA